MAVGVGDGGVTEPEDVGVEDVEEVAVSVGRQPSFSEEPDGGGEVMKMRMVRSMSAGLVETAFIRSFRIQLMCSICSVS